MDRTQSAKFEERRCAWCGKIIPDMLRANAVACTPAHQRMAKKHPGFTKATWEAQKRGA